MNATKIYSLILLFFIMSDLIAQEKQIRSIQWNVAGFFPSTANEEKPLGLSGVAAGTNNGVLIIAGGTNFPAKMPWEGGKKKYYDNIYVYARNRNQKLELLKTYKLPNSLGYSAAVSTRYGLFVGGGEKEGGPVPNCFLISWDAIKDTISLKNLPDLPLAVTNASAAIYNNKVYLAGGEMANAVSDKLFVLDLQNIEANWKTLAAIPRQVSHAVLLAQLQGSDACLYLVGGRKKIAGNSSTLYSSNFCYHISENKWSVKQSIPYTLSAGTGVAYGKRYLLLLGGDKGETFHKTEELLVQIANEGDSLRKDKLIQEKNQVQITHPGFTKEVLLYNTKTDQWRHFGTIPFEVPVTTTAVKWGPVIYITGGEIKAGVRTDKILAGNICN
ncbi:MAG: hypothetical protein ACM3VS_15640 [Candidatus Dadabacteria bacterium]